MEVGDNTTLRQLCPREIYPVTTVQEAGWAPRPVWTGAENLASTGIGSLDRPARGESLYRLPYSLRTRKQAQFGAECTCRGKGQTMTCLCRYRGETQVSHQPTHNLATTPRPLYPRKRPGTNFTGGEYTWGQLDTLGTPAKSKHQHTGTWSATALAPRLLLSPSSIFPPPSSH